MSVSAPSTTLALAPRLNALAVMVQGQQDVLVEMQKTKEVFAEYVNESQETIASQAEENQKLKAELASLKQMHEREMAAEKAKVSNRQGEIDWYRSALEKDERRIAELTILFDKHMAALHDLRAIICDPSLHSRPGYWARIPHGNFLNAKAIINRTIN